MQQDKATQAVIEFAFKNQEPLKALRTLTRAGQIAAVYYTSTGVECDFDELFSRSNTK